jgi:hypothetical protein
MTVDSSLSVMLAALPIGEIMDFGWLLCLACLFAGWTMNSCLRSAIPEADCLHK